MRRILTAQYAPGQRVPPERELLEEFGCSRLTVAKAMVPLVEEGLIARRQGRGTFVANRGIATNGRQNAPRFNGRAVSRGNLPTALFASHDHLAIAILNALQGLGISVPSQLSVAGYDGIEAGEFGATPLTSIKQDFGGMASIAAKILMERFDGRPTPLRYQKLIKPRLIVRATCVAPRS